MDASQASLTATLQTAVASEAELHRLAWALCAMPIPPDVSDLLDRGAYLESVLALADTCALQGELMSWEISYTSVGAPYGGAMEIRSTDGTVRSLSSMSDGSATRALLAVLLKAAA